MDKTTEEVVNRGMDMLDALACKVGTTVEHLWPYLIKQQIVNGVISISTLLFGLLLLICGFKWFPEDADMNDKKVIVLVIFICTGAVITLISSIATLSTLPELINPEYGAINDLVTLIQRMK